MKNDGKYLFGPTDWVWCANKNLSGYQAGFKSLDDAIRDAYDKFSNEFYVAGISYYHLDLAKFRFSLKNHLNSLTGGWSIDPLPNCHDASIEDLENLIGGELAEWQRKNDVKIRVSDSEVVSPIYKVTKESWGFFKKSKTKVEIVMTAEEFRSRI